ncbi:hypothetical protein CR513_58420, partial [Mucuna pruriens]
MALAAGSSIHIPLLQTSNSRAHIAMTTTERGGSVLQMKRRQNEGRGNDQQTNNIGLLQSTTTKRESDLQRKRRHQGEGGSDPQTN